jgi:hypothetical protein
MTELWGSEDNSRGSRPGLLQGCWPWLWPGCSFARYFRYSSWMYPESLDWFVFRSERPTYYLLASFRMVVCR